MKGGLILNRSAHALIGVAFILTSGLLFTIERLTYYLAVHPTESREFYFQNWFVWIFLLTGLLILFFSFHKEIRDFFIVRDK